MPGAWTWGWRSRRPSVPCLPTGQVRSCFPKKIVQIFDQDTQSRINCLPATLPSEKICGVKWVSVFPENPRVHGIQNLSAVIILSEIEHGFPIALLEGILCSNMRVGAMGGIAAKHFARPDSRSIAFRGAGERAKMHLVAMMKVIPAASACRVPPSMNTRNSSSWARWDRCSWICGSSPRRRISSERRREQTSWSLQQVRKHPCSRRHG